MTDPRDDAIERLLRRNTDRPDVGAEVCLDAETAAAFADGALRPHERAAVEAHAADCPRCLALVATMARIHEPADRPSRWRLPRIVGWAVPVATAATAIGLWVYVGQDGAPAPPLRSVASPAAETAPASPAIAPPPADGARTAPQPARPKASAAPLGALVSPPTTPIEETARSEKSARAVATIPAAPPAPPIASVPVDRLAQLESRTVQVQAPPPMTETVVVGVAADQPLPRAALRAVVGAVQIRSSDPKLVWRIAETMVQRSTDGGVTWTTEPTPATKPLRAGSAPSTSVCWLVGSAGTVLLWVEGQGWRQVPFPEDVDLTAIAATSARDAEVVTTNNRRFLTADGGQTWVGR